jgi:hypothetical protein
MKMCRIRLHFFKEWLQQLDVAGRAGKVGIEHFPGADMGARRFRLPMESIKRMAATIETAAMKLLGIFCCALGFGLVALFSYSFYRLILPFYFDKQKSFLFWSIAIFFSWIVLNVLFNYSMAVLRDPGRAPPASDTDIEQVIHNDQHIQLKNCRKCFLIFLSLGGSKKPARAHHCSTCNRCVLKMDHHCRKCFLLQLGLMAAWATAISAIFSSFFFMQLQPAPFIPSFPSALFFPSSVPLQRVGSEASCFYLDSWQMLPSVAH